MARPGVSGTDPTRPNKLSTDVYLWRPADGQLAKLSAFEDTANANGFVTYYPSYLAVGEIFDRLASQFADLHHLFRGDRVHDLLAGNRIVVAPARLPGIGRVLQVAVGGGVYLSVDAGLDSGCRLDWRHAAFRVP